MKSLLLALLLAVAAPLRAIVFEFDPPVGDTRTAVTVTMHGVWGSPAGPHVKSFTVSGRTIDIHLEQYHGGVLAVTAPWIARAHLPLLRGGVYDIAVHFDDYPDVPPVHASLIVRDREVIWPNKTAIPITGGDNAFGIITPPADEVAYRERITSVSIDNGATWILGSPMQMPPHAAGTVDVIAKTSLDRTIDAAAAFTYYDPAAPPDPALFEPVLFPASFAGPGAYGAAWTTVNSLRAGAGWVWFSAPLPCEGCSNRLDETMVTLPPTGNGAGQILYAMRFNSRFDAACRVTNRTSGTVSPLPVLREKDIFQPKDYGTTDFLGVPRPPNSRIVLRVWLFTHVAGTYANVRAEGANGSATDTLALTRLSDGLLFGTSDITRQIDAAGAPVRVSTSFAVDDYYDGHAWLLLTMTDNETGRVTVVPR